MLWSHKEYRVRNVFRIRGNVRPGLTVSFVGQRIEFQGMEDLTQSLYHLTKIDVPL